MRRMMGSDAGMLYQERLPDQPLHTVKVLVVEPGPGTTPASLAAVVVERARHVEPLRWQPVDVPAHLFHPLWRAVDPDPDQHVDTVELSSPDRAGLEAEVSRLAGTPLERDRPLWHVTIAHGLADDRLAVILRLHHAIADGGSSVRIMTQLADGADLDQPADPEPAPGPTALAAGAARDLGRAVAGLPGLAARTGRAISTGRIHSQAAAVDPPKPFMAPDSLYNRPLSGSRACAFADLDLDRLRVVKERYDCSLNDVYLTLCGGAIRRHLEHHDLLPDGALTTSIPVSVRRDPDDHRYGNRVGNWFTSLATDEADPVDRLQAVREQTRVAKAKFDERDQLLECDWQELWPLYIVVGGYIPRFGRRLAKRPAWNVIASNVRGPDPMAIDGDPVVALHSTGPLIYDLGLNLTGWSYGRTMSVGAHACADHVDDVDRLVDGLPLELDALLG